MSYNAYRLVNPYIEGSLNTVVRAKNSSSAGRKIYHNLSKYFTNHVEDFNISVQNIESKELSHFNINEKRGKNKTIKFHLSQIEDALPSKVENKLLDHVGEIEKHYGGGKHKKDDSFSSSSSSSSEEDYYKSIPIAPINKLIYYYLPYRVNYVGLTAYDYYKLFVPAFSWPLSPSIEIRFDIYKYFAT